MTDRYTAFVNGPPGRALAKRLGLPRPVPLRRSEPGQPLLVGPALVAGVGTPLPLIDRVLRGEGAGTASDGDRLGAVVYDACAATEPADLEHLRAVLAHA